MYSEPKLPVVKIESHYRTRERLVVGGKTKIVADKILRHELFDTGTKIAVIFKDRACINNLADVNLAIVHLDEDVRSFVLLSPQPEPEEATDLLSDRHLGNDKNVVMTWRSAENIYTMASDDLSTVAGPFTPEEVGARYEAADYRLTSKEIYEALIRESRYK